jgi:hypothetical protein
MATSALKTPLRPAIKPVRRPSADFDFLMGILMGIWNVRHRYLVRRLSDCHDWIEFPGTCAARKILDGYGNTDESEISLPGDRYRGMSLRTYDPTSGKWSILWLDSRRPGHITPPVIGGFAKVGSEPVGTFYGDDTFGDRAIRVRFVWSRITPQSARREQAFSLDEGNSWETNWVMDFTRL